MGISEDVDFKWKWTGKNRPINNPAPNIRSDVSCSYDFEWAIGMNRFSLSILGVWPKPSKIESKKRLHLRITIVIVSMLSGLFLPQFYGIFQVYEELPLVIDNLITSSGCFISSIKLLILWHSKNVLSPVVASMLDDWFDWKYDWERQIMIKMAKRGRTYTLCGYGIMVGTFFGVTCSPMFGFSYRIFTNITDRNERYLPVQSYYPYNYWETPWFEFSYCTQMIAICITACCFSSSATFFGALAFHISGQLQIISMRLANLHLPVAYHDDSVWHSSISSFSGRIRYIVEAHVHIIENITRVERAFHMVVFAHLVVLSIMMCCLGYQFITALKGSSNGLPISQLLVIVMAILNMLIHTFIYCEASETLFFYNDEMYRSIYASNWYALRRQVAMDLIPIMIRSKTILRLTAGKFIYLSLETYCDILKTSAGYISVLLAVGSK